MLRYTSISPSAEFSQTKNLFFRNLVKELIQPLLKVFLVPRAFLFTFGDTLPVRALKNLISLILNFYDKSRY